MTTSASRLQTAQPSRSFPEAFQIAKWPHWWERDLSLCRDSQHILQPKSTEQNCRDWLPLGQSSSIQWPTNNDNDQRIFFWMYNNSIFLIWKSFSFFLFYSSICNKLLGITYLCPHNELVHLPYIAVASNTK